MEAVMKRRSIREFKPDGVPEGVLDKLVDAIIWAPSAGNLQSRVFYLVRESEAKKRLASAALGQNFIAGAPVVFVGCADVRTSGRYGQRGASLYSVQDVSASVMAMMLAAVGEGLGTVWVGAFEESKVSSVLGIPDHLRPVALVPVGYPARVPSPPPRVSKDRAIVEI